MAQRSDRAAPGAPGRPRASTLRAVGSVALVAAVAASGLAVWVRAGGALTEQPEDVGLDEPLPHALAGGEPLREVPPELSEAVGGAPVVGAAIVERLPDGFDGCSMDPAFHETADLEYAVITPEGLTVSMVGPAPPGMFGVEAREEMVVDGVVQLVPAREPSTQPRARAVCTAVWEGGAWREHGGSMGPADEHMHMGMGASCCDERGLGTASAQIGVPDGAAWLLQERGDWWLALPVADVGAVPLTWKFRDSGFGPSGRFTHVLWLDEHGTTIDEAYPAM